ncbi:hypothetical protein OG792_03465 [Micromonospora sp. NBC_01699]|uniref:hypothetical protein n=1 Tax=Micromonospora sp. NBC_01699 TaxID=2975984 RepID=UPI002E2D50CE|nr:hypothetical protein [Micromonospora sp. NBC_01699]
MDEDDDLIAAHRNNDAWQCADCRDPWPCPTFRRRLRILYQREPGKLRTFMMHFRDRAAPELSELDPAQLDTRFLGWISGPPPGSRLRSI